MVVYYTQHTCLGACHDGSKGSSLILPFYTDCVIIVRRKRSPHMLLGGLILICMFFVMSVVFIGAKIKGKYFYKGWRRNPRIIYSS